MRHENGLQDNFDDGTVALGAGTDTFSPIAIEVYGHIGLDFVWLDFEHAGPSPYDAPVIEELTRAGEAAGIDLLIRIPSGDPPLIRKVLDAGARTLLIPRVESAGEVEQAIEAARFTYGDSPGERGVGIGRTTTWGNSVERQPQIENDSVMVGAMIENASAVSNLEDILDVSGLGFVFIGPADLSVSLGHPWQWDHPEVTETVEHIVATATDSGVPVGGITTDAASAIDGIEQGYQLLHIGGDISSAQAVLSERLKDIREARNSDTTQSNANEMGGSIGRGGE